VPQTYLTAKYAERAQVKALGAKWDQDQGQWYVPDGHELAPFCSWLPAGLRTGVALVDEAALPSNELVVAAKGIGLLELMGRLADVVKHAYATWVWVRVEITNVRLTRGAVSLEFTEAVSGGSAVAQARGVIWKASANQIIPAFEKATGVVLAAGIKLLVKARPNLHPLYGLSLVIEEIDHEYTLGELEARKREIRMRLQHQGLFDANRQLLAPWDYRAVLVLAPQQAAGLGDFQAEASRLETLGICHFTYLHSRFQGVDAAVEMRRALASGLDDWRGAHADLPDAIVIIRGGGAVNDLAWLNDYDLARSLCELPVPVLTGIGHERDSTILDEVAHTCFDTPSKVIAGIEQTIVTRVREAKSSFLEIVTSAQQLSTQFARNVEHAYTSVQAGGQRQVALAATTADRLIGQIERDARESVGAMRAASENSMAAVRLAAARQIATAQQQVPGCLTEVMQQARLTIGAARTQASTDFGAMLSLTAAATRRGYVSVGGAFADVAKEARRSVSLASSGSEALMREIAGQGPEKTLSRGFALVRTEIGEPVTSAGDAIVQQSLRIQFKDGVVQAVTPNQIKEDK
jgi:exodeoxyribonuclease VII large subunit